MLIRETEHYALEVREMFDGAGNYRNRFVIRNKVYDVEEVVMDLFHIVNDGLDKLEEATYQMKLGPDEEVSLELGLDPLGTEPTIN